MKNYLFIIIIILSSTQLIAQSKSMEVLLNDETKRYYPVGEVSKITFKDDVCGGVRTLIYSGKKYSTVQIGTQCWLAQNLDVGNFIHTDQNQTDNTIIEKYCFNNIEDQCNLLGG